MTKYQKVRNFTAGIVALSGLFVLAGCGTSSSSGAGNSSGNTSGNTASNTSQSKNGKTYTIGVLINGIAMYSYYKKEYEGIKNEVKKLEQQDGVTIKLDVEDTQNNPQTELSDAKTLILKKVQLVLYTPTTYDAGVTIAKKFKAAKIPVIAMDRAAGNTVASYVGYDNVKLGSVQAKMAVSYLNGKGVVAEETGALGSANQIARSKGWKQVFSANSGIKIAANQTNNFDPAKAYSVTKSILQAHPNVQVILSQDDPTAVGVEKAVLAAKSKAVVIGLGASTGGMKSIQDGQLYGTVLMEPYAIGQKATDLTLQYLQGKQIPKTADPSPYTVITSKNISQFINSPAAGW